MLTSIFGSVRIELYAYLLPYLFLNMTGLPPAGKVSTSKPERLGVAGLALHYANIITQIDNIVSLLQT